MPILSTCLRLALEVVDAADRVVANHTRCERLVSRINRMVPLLRTLEDKLGGAEAAADLPPHIAGQLANIRDVLMDCLRCVLAWTAKSDSKLKVLLNLVMSRTYQSELIELNDRLSAAYNDLGLVLNIQQATGTGAVALVARPDREALAREVEEDLRVDLRKQAEALTAAGGADWQELSAEQRQEILGFYSLHGLDLELIMKNVSGWDVQGGGGRGGGGMQ